MRSSRANTAELLWNPARVPNRDRARTGSPAQVRALKKSAVESKNTMLPATRNADAAATNVYGRLQHLTAPTRQQLQQRVFVNRAILTTSLSPTLLLVPRHNPCTDRQSDEHHHTRLALRP
jgi:hypothetical protein